MAFTTDNILLISALLLIAGILIQKPGYKFGVPALLLFLGVGMIFGCDGLGFEFSNMEMAQFVGMIALSIILFSGGMDTRIGDIKPILLPGTLLSTVGVLLTTAITGVFIWWTSQLSWTSNNFALLPSLLLAATMSSTDSASVFAMLRSQKMNLKHNLRPLLEFESGSNDPMAFLLTTILLGVITHGGSLSAGSIILMLLVQFAVGFAIGYAMGRMGTFTMNHLRLDNSAFYPILLLGLVFLTFSSASLLNGNGYLAVYIAGIVVGNNKITYRRETQTFINGLSWLFQIVMFLMLGLLVNPHEMFKVAPIALFIGGFMILVGRPLAVWISLLPFRNIPRRAKLFVSWVGLRGAVPILFATYPVVAGVEDHHTIFNIAFFITIVSLLVQGTTITSMANTLGLAEPQPHNVEDYGIALPEDSGSHIDEIIVNAETLEAGNTLKDMKMPQGQLVMMVKRGNQYLVPNGQLQIEIDDRLLLIKANQGDSRASM